MSEISMNCVKTPTSMGNIHETSMAVAEEVADHKEVAGNLALSLHSGLLLWDRYSSAVLSVPQHVQHAHLQRSSHQAIRKKLQRAQL